MKTKKFVSTEKLRRMRIWPSIVTYVMTMVMIAGLVFSFLLLFFEYVSQARISASFMQTRAIADELNARVYGENLSSVTEEIGKNSDKGAAFAVIDDDGAVLSSYGILSYNHFNGIEIPSLSSAEGYLDIYSKNDTLSIPPSLILDYAFDSMLFTSAEGDDSEKIYEVIYWIEIPLATDNMNLISKTELIIVRNDIKSVLAICIIGIAITFIPFILMIINSIMMIRTQRRFTALFYHDNITGGHNWAYFKAKSLKLLKKKKKRSRLYAIIDFELTNYRRYCALQGTERGEQLLTQIDDYLDEITDANEISAHYARSSFVLMLMCRSKEELIDRLYAIMGRLSRLDAESRTLYYHAGVKFFRTGPKFKLPSIPEYFAHADAAGATIDGIDGNRVAVFNQELLDNQVWEQYVIDSLDRAIAAEEFKVYLQPKYNPVTKTIEGAEALVRWINDEYGFISPGKFIPILEKTGLIVKLDDYMLAHVAQLQARWISEDKNTVRISVNVSRAHFAHPNLAEHIRSIVDTYATPHELVEIELTESAFFDDKNLLVNTVKRLKSYGFEVSMDDFGAGYSSLNSLKDLSLDVLKLDADFFRGDDDEKRGEIVVSEAICLAKRLEMQIVAEGIEKKEQVDFLAECGCDLIQGYYFAKPMPIGEYEKLAYEEKAIGGSKFSKPEQPTTEEAETTQKAQDEQTLTPPEETAAQEEAAVQEAQGEQAVAQEALLQQEQGESAEPQENE